MRLCIIQTKSGGAYGVLLSFSQSLGEALIRAGAHVEIEDTLNYPVNPTRFDATISFFSIWDTPWEKSGVPHLYVTVDTLDYFSHLINNKNITISVRDLTSLEMLHEMGFHKTFFLPHAAEKNLNFNPNAKRPYDLVFFASSSMKKMIDENLSLFPKEVEKAARDAVLLFLKEPNISYHQAFITCAENEGISKFFLSCQNLVHLMKTIEMLARYYDRLHLLQSFKKLPVHIFGDQGLSEWKELLSDQKNLYFHPPIPFEETLKIMQQSKLVLNASATIKTGAHERIFYALQSGALPITSYNNFLSEWYYDQENILFYTPLAAFDIEDKAQYLLKNEPLRKESARKGRDLVLKYHTWDHRAADILKFFATL